MTANALWPLGWKFAMVPSFFAAWLTVELAQFTLLGQVVTLAAFVAAGAADGGLGIAAGVMLGASIIGTISLLVTAQAAGQVMDRVLCEALGDDYRDKIPASLMAG